MASSRFKNIMLGLLGTLIFFAAISFSTWLATPINNVAEFKEQGFSAIMSEFIAGLAKAGHLVTLSDVSLSWTTITDALSLVVCLAFFYSLLFLIFSCIGASTDGFMIAVLVILALLVTGVVTTIVHTATSIEKPEVGSNATVVQIPQLPNSSSVIDMTGAS